MDQYAVRFLSATKVLIHERITDDPVWYLTNMVNWLAMEQGETIEIVKKESN